MSVDYLPSSAWIISACAEIRRPATAARGSDRLARCNQSPAQRATHQGAALAGKIRVFADFRKRPERRRRTLNLMQRHDDWRGQNNIPGILPALIVIGIGVLFLLNNLNIFYMHDIWRFWPVILIAAGLAKMVDSPYSNGAPPAAFWWGSAACFWPTRSASSTSRGRISGRWC